MRKPGNTARYSLGLALAALTTATILALVHVALAQAQVVTPSWTAATALPTLHANGKIAFTSDRDGNSEIYVMNPDGSNQVRLTNNSVVDDNAEWSPDGRRIAFTCGRPSGGFALCLMNADGTNRTEVIALPSATAISWSPDGSRLAYDEDSDIYVVNVDGTNRRKLIGGYFDPSWSPDGLRILFWGFLNGGPILHTIRPDGTGLQALPNDFESFGDFSPQWSPSGDKIVFIVNVYDFYTVVFTANADGTNRQLLDGCPTSYCPDGDDRAAPHWSPDGTKVVFHISNRFHTRQDLYKRNTDGTGFVQLTDGPGRNTNPSWQPLLPTACPNPIDCNEFFVRQQYQDFLNREPDAGGLAYWTNRIAECGSDTHCINERRIGVSAAFFVEMEFQDTGYYVYCFYKASFGRQPTFTEFTADRGKVIGGSNLEANKQAFADEWVQRQSFRDAYPITMSNTEVVNKLFDSAGLTSSRYDAQRQQEILAMNSGPSRALVLRDVIEIPDFKNIADPNDPRYSELKQISQYNPAFVLTQYYGYLKRDKDQSGYDFWLDVVNNRQPNNYRAMVCAFITSSEYQLRFGTAVTRSNNDCAP